MEGRRWRAGRWKAPVVTVSEGLPRRARGTHLPEEAYGAVGRVPVPNVDDRWYLDDRDLRVLLNALRQWQVMGS